MLIWRPACGGTAAFGSWAGPHGKGPRTARRERGAAVPGGEGRPALPGAQFPTRRWAEGGKLRGRSLRGPRGKWRLAVPLAPAPAPLPFQGLFRAEPWESVSPVAEISLEPARRGCKLPPRPDPPAALRSPGGAAGRAGDAGPRSQPPEARGRSWIGRLRRGGRG